MFRNTFQSGFLSILYSIGSKPLQIWEKEVQPKLNTSDECVARFEALPFTTSGGVCKVQTLKGCDIG